MYCISELKRQFAKFQDAAFINVEVLIMRQAQHLYGFLDYTYQLISHC